MYQVSHVIHSHSTYRRLCKRGDDGDGGGGSGGDDGGGGSG